MATIAQQLSQAQQIESAIPRQEAELKKQQAEAEKIRAKQLDIRRQVELQKAGKFREFQARGGLAGEKERARKERERRFGLIEASRGHIRRTKEDISKFKQSLSTNAVKLQYAKEQGLKGRPIYGRVVKGGTIEIVGYEYTTPFGKVVDRSPEYRLRKMQAKLDRNQGAQLDQALKEGSFLSGGVVFTKSGDIDKRFQNLASQRLQRNIDLISPPPELKTRVETVAPTYLAGGPKPSSFITPLDSSKEYYDPRLDLVLKSESTPLRKSVEVSRMPSIEEKESYGRIVRGDASEQNILGVNLQDLSKQTKEYESSKTSLIELSTGKQFVLEDIERLGGKVIRKEGSYSLEKPRDPKKLKQYEILVRQLKNLEKREQAQLKRLERTGGGISEEGILTAPTIKTGILGFTRQTPITEFKGVGESFLVPKSVSSAKDLVISTSRTVSEPFNILGLTLGSTTGVRVQRKLESLGVGELSPKKTINLPSIPESFSLTTRTGVEVTPVVNAFLPKSVTIGPVNPESIGKAVSGTTRTGVEIGKYFIPVVGNVAFTTEVAGSLAESDFSPSKFIKENPLQATILGGIATYKLGKGVSKVLKSSKYGKFIAKPEAKIINLKTRPIKNTIKESRLRPRVDIRSQDGIKRLGISARKKGATKTTELYQTKSLSGRVSELRDIGRIRFSYNKGRIRIEKAIKEYSGVAGLSAQGKYIESISYGKGLKKVTTIGKSGKGQIELFKKGKLIKKTDIKSEPFSKLGDLKTDSQGIIINKRFLDKDLKSTLIKGKVQRKVGTRSNLDTGEFNVQIGTKGYTDIIKAGPRKGLLQIKTNQKNIVLKTQKGQNIKFGRDKSYDITRGVFKGDKRVLTKNIGPNVQRNLQSGSESEIILGFINPSSKALKSARNLEALKSKEWARVIKNVKRDKFTTAFKSKTNLFKEKIDSLRLPSFARTKGGGKVQSSGQSLQSAYEYGTPEYFASLSKVGISSSMVPKLGSTLYVPPTSASISSIPQVSLSVPQSASYILASSPSAGQASLTSEKLVYGISNLGGTTTDTRLDLRQQEILKTETKPDTRFDTNIIQDTSFSTKTSPRLDISLTPITKTDLKLDLKQETRISQDPTSPFRERQEEILREKEADKNIDIKIPLGRQEKVRKAKRIIKGFESFTRTKGRDVSIGEFATLGRAKKELAKTLKSTLRASGFVTRSGKKIKADELGFYGKEYRVSKLDPFRVVQKRSSRLGTKSEVKEIQLFKKRKGGKSKKAKSFSWL